MVVIGYDVIGMVKKTPKMFFRYNTIRSEHHGNIEFRRLSKEHGGAAINLFAGMNLKVNEKDEVVDVCRAWEEQKKSGQIEERIDIISKFLENGGTKEEAKRMLEVSEEDIIMAEKRISEIHQTICV